MPLPPKLQRGCLRFEEFQVWAHPVLRVHQGCPVPSACVCLPWGAFLVLALVGSCLAYSLYMQGVKDIGSMRASLIGTVEPVSAAVTSAIVLGTVFTGTDIVGFACIIIMMVLTV